MSKIRNELIEAFSSYRASVTSFQQAFSNVSQEEIDEFFKSECASLVDAANILGFKLPASSDTVHVVIHALDEAPVATAPEAQAAPREEAQAAPKEEAQAAPTEEAQAAPEEEAQAAPKEEARAVPEFDALAFLQK